MGTPGHALSPHGDEQRGVRLGHGVPRRWSPLAMALVVAVACSPIGELQDGPVAAPATTTTAAPASTTTTTTAPVPADVQDLIALTTMTERARRIFLAASPAVEDPTAFARHCGVDSASDASEEPRVHTQGCYVNGRIHLLARDRSDARELLYVVAAHELLHAVYASLGSAERSRIDPELDAARAGNERLEERLRPYGGGPILANEIHSILGSEFDGLSPALEAHYAQYFVDRRRVVAARERTLGAREDEIRRLKDEVDRLDARITSLKDGQEALRSAGNVRGYNANVAVINGLISRYNDQVADLNARIEEYNAVLG